MDSITYELKSSKSSIEVPIEAADIAELVVKNASNPNELDFFKPPIFEGQRSK